MWARRNAATGPSRTPSSPRPATCSSGSTSQCSPPSPPRSAGCACRPPAPRPRLMRTARACVSLPGNLIPLTLLLSSRFFAGDVHARLGPGRLRGQRLRLPGPADRRGVLRPDRRHDGPEDRRLRLDLLHGLLLRGDGSGRPPPHPPPQPLQCRHADVPSRRSAAAEAGNRHS